MLNLRHRDTSVEVVKIRAVHGETGNKAEQGTNLKTDVADRSDAHLSNVWILARQVLHLHTHREAGTDRELLNYIMPDSTCFLLPPVQSFLLSQSPCQCPGSPAAAPQAQAHLAPAPKQLYMRAMQLQKQCRIRLCACLVVWLRNTQYATAQYRAQLQHYPPQACHAAAPTAVQYTVCLAAGLD